MKIQSIKKWLSTRYGHYSLNVGLWVLWIFTLCWFSLPFAFRTGLYQMEDSREAEWLVAEDVNKSKGYIFKYKDVSGYIWYRLMPNASGEENPLYTIKAKEYPEGCDVTWFSEEGNTLRICSLDESIDHGLGIGYIGSQYPRILSHEKISKETLQAGISLGLMDSAYGSIYVRLKSCSISQDAWYENDTGLDSHSIWLLGAIILSCLSWISLSVYYLKTGKFRFAFAALAYVFLLGACVFDRPYSGFGGQIDAGDDSYYLAYAQNLITKGTFFIEPTSIEFGARQVKVNHGLPGTGLFLAPAPLIQSFLIGAPLSRNIDLNGLRAMRVLSSLYSFSAMLLLCLAFHLIRPGFWNVAYSSFLLWGTSLSKWTFQRCIFTHSIEMAFLSAMLLVLIWAWTKPAIPFWKGVILGLMLGGAFLVRGEYLVAIPLLPFLLSGQIRENRRYFREFWLGYSVSISLCVGCYISWVHRISTGYGRLSSSQTQFISSVSSLTDYFSRMFSQLGVLLESFWSSGFVLFGALILYVGILIGISIRRRRLHINMPQDIPLNWKGLGCLALVFLLMNANFHTPLGMEWQHRYALKLYPLAFMVLWIGRNMFALRWRRIIDVCLALVLFASLIRHLQSFYHISLHGMQDAGFLVWSDDQLFIQGLNSPYGLSILAGLILTSFGLLFVALLRCYRSKKPLWISIIIICIFPLIFAHWFGKELEQADVAGIQLRYYNSNSKKVEGSRLLDRLSVWDGPKRPAWTVNSHAYEGKGEGYLFVPSAGEYSFFSESKDGLRIYLDNALLLDSWQSRSWAGSGRHGKCVLSAGIHDFRVEHCKHSGDGGFRVKWAGGGIPRNTILGAPYLRRKQYPDYVGDIGK